MTWRSALVVSLAISFASAVPYDGVGAAKYASLRSRWEPFVSDLQTANR